MTDRERVPVAPGVRTIVARPRKRRVPKGVLRVQAWVGGGLSFMAPVAVLGMAPKPAPAATTPTAQAQEAPRTVVVHHIVRKVIVREPAARAGGTTVVSGGSTSGVIYVPAPAAAPATTTGGSGHP